MKNLMTALSHRVGRDDVERRVVINTVGPHWDGNQVWFITGGGAIFAAWPPLYAVSFSGFVFQRAAAARTSMSFAIAPSFPRPPEGNAGGDDEFPHSSGRPASRQALIIASATVRA